MDVWNRFVHVAPRTLRLSGHRIMRTVIDSRISILGTGKEPQFEDYLSIGATIDSRRPACNTLLYRVSSRDLFPDLSDGLRRALTLDRPLNANSIFIITCPHCEGKVEVLCNSSRTGVGKNGQRIQIQIKHVTGLGKKGEGDSDPETC